MKIDYPALAYWLSLALIGGGGVYAFRKNKIGWKDAAVFLALVVFAHVMTYELFDVFHDGVVYHQPAISRIAEGFNPVYDGYMYLGRNPDMWSDNATHYPKAAWYFAAAVTDALGDIQTGKAYASLLLFASIFFALYCSKDEHILKRLLWVMVCLNPLTLTQLAAYVSDGALASLCVMSLLYARFFFNGKWPPDKSESRAVHVIGVLSLVFMACVKTSGVAYSCIIIFCVCLHRMFREHDVRKGFKNAFVLGLKLGGAMVLLSAILACAPYVTDALKGRHMFYSAYHGDLSEYASNESIENIAKAAFPDAHNRFTRFFLSLVAYPSSDLDVQVLFKNPFGAPMLEWRQFAAIGNMNSAVFGPFFYLLCILALIYSGASYVYFRFRKHASYAFEGWLLFTIVFMTVIQPHSWHARFAPFVWLMPIVLFMCVPKKKEYLLSVPLLIFFINISGIMYFFVPRYVGITQDVHAALDDFRGQTVLLDRSTSQMDGIFRRFGIKQKFANPEAVTVSNEHWLTPRPERKTGRMAFGSSIAFGSDIPPLPKEPLDMSSNAAKPYLAISDGLIPIDIEDHGNMIIKMLVSRYRIPETGLWNYRNRVKFYMRVMDKPEGDMELSVTSVRKTTDEGLDVLKTEVYANERLLGEWLWDTPGRVDKTVVIPRSVLEESYNDDLSLLTLRFETSRADKDGANYADSIYRLKFERMRITPLFSPSDI
ncbi:hypothetical protein AGMMS49957_14940 [Synergistales bacterium]|nr:hypothetical protein AGMMS49957_14940 [Synergistales bacterium]